MSGGSPLIFFQRGISLTLIVGAVLLLLSSLAIVRYTSRRVKEEAAEELEL
jgi:TctA family transporter